MNPWNGIESHSRLLVSGETEKSGYRLIVLHEK